MKADTLTLLSDRSWLLNRVLEHRTEHRVAFFDPLLLLLEPSAAHSLEEDCGGYQNEQYCAGNTNPGVDRDG